MPKAFILNRKKYFLFVIPLVLFLLIRFVLLRPPSDDIVYIVTREDLVDTVQVSGTYHSSSQTEIFSPTNGILSELFVQNGDFVEKGEPLFHVESTATESQQKEVYATLLAAKAALDSDKAKLFSLQSTMFAAWDKYTDLSTNSTYENSDGSPKSENRILPEFTTAQNDWLAAEANYKNQQGVIAKDQAVLANAQLSYSQTQSTTVKSQSTGIVNNFLRKNGDQVEANTTDPILIISGSSNPYMEAEISEEYATRVGKGQQVSVVFDALKDKVFTEKVEEINTIGKEKNGITVYTTRISAKDISSNIKPRMTALITIQTLKKPNVLTVPNSAVLEEGGKTYVLNAQKKRISVTTGIKGLIKTEIVTGLKEGNTILANPK